MTETVDCPFCGASRRRCELEDETGGVCPWEESEDSEEAVRRRERDAEARQSGGLSPLGKAIVLDAFPYLKAEPEIG
jgi:hypothetical protein